MIFIKYIGNTTTHTSGKVLARMAKNNSLTTCHILKTMVTTSFTDCSSS